jgi:hypothetical protein
MLIIFLAEWTKSASFFGIGPVIERVDSDNTSTSKSVDKLVKPSSENKPTTVVKPVSNAKSWSDDTVSAPPAKKQEPRSNSWDTSISDDDDDTNISKSKHPSTKLHKTQPFSASVINLSSSDTDDNSVDTKIRKVDIQKPTNDTGVNKAIGLSKAQSPTSDESSWTTSPVPFNEELPTKGIQNLVKKIKSDDSTWDDDSRPLSVDLSKGQETGVENLIKIMDTIMHSNKKQTSPKVIGKLVVSSMVDRTDSILSENSLHETDNDARMNSISLFLFFVSIFDSFQKVGKRDRRIKMNLNNYHIHPYYYMITLVNVVHPHHHLMM